MYAHSKPHLYGQFWFSNMCVRVISVLHTVFSIVDDFFGFGISVQSISNIHRCTVILSHCVDVLDITMERSSKQNKRERNGKINAKHYSRSDYVIRKQHSKRIYKSIFDKPNFHILLLNYSIEFFHTVADRIGSASTNNNLRLHNNIWRRSISSKLNAHHHHHHHHSFNDSGAAIEDNNRRLLLSFPLSSHWL